MTFGERLKLAMWITGTSNKDLAKRCGLNQTAVSHFTGGVREPSLKNLGKLLRALPGVDARWFVGDDSSVEQIIK